MLLDKLIVNKNTRKCLLLFCELLSKINLVVPKKSNWIFFCESVHCEFHDNSRHIYEYIKSHNEIRNYRYILCVSDVAANKNLRSRNTLIVGRIRGAILFVFCKYCFYSYSFLKINPSRAQIVVNQWHGSPLKAIGALSKHPINPNEKEDTFTYLLAAAPVFVPILAKSFKCPEKKILLCGHSRTDAFYENTNTLSLFGLSGYNKTVLWMPTFRVSIDGRHQDLGPKDNCDKNETFLPLIKMNKDLVKLNTWLSAENILLVIKIHSISPWSDIELSNIKLFKDSDIQKKEVLLYQFVKDFDALLTDYSSVYFDYLLLNRPIGFIVDDINLYIENRGFNFDKPLDLMPGRLIYDQSDLYDFFYDVKANHDLFEKQRKEVMALTNYYKDGNNCKRLLDMIGL